MNILFLSRTMGQGGAEKIVYQLAVETAKKGAGVLVASCGGVYVEMLADHHIRHIQVDDLECKNPRIIMRTLKILVDIIRAEKIDIIHSHHRMAQFYAFILRIMFPDVKVVYTAHNVFFDKTFFTRMILRGSIIVSVGDGVRENLIHTFGIDSGRIRVIYNGIQVERMEEAYLSDTLRLLRQRRIRLLGIIGRLSEQKGIDVFLKAISRIKCAGFSVKGVIIGDGEDRDKIRQWMADMGLEDDIIMMGYQQHIPSLISQLDLVVMPSRWEGFPLLPLEVFSAHRTMVASDISGINEIVKHMENGILVQKDDVQAFAGEIIRLLEDTELRTRLEDNGSHTFERYYHYGDFVDAYYQVYQELVGDCE